MHSKQIAFFGDSLTAGFPGASFVKIIKQSHQNLKIHNYGRSGDTVKSHYERISSLPLIEKSSTAFLWIGINDIFIRLSLWYYIYKVINGQSWTTTLREFEQYYHKNIQLILPTTQKLVCFSLLCIGENLENLYNQEIDTFNAIIQKTVSQYPNVIFEDTRQAFSSLFKTDASDYLPEHPIDLVIDTIFSKVVRSAKTPEILSNRRNLNFTIDGVHLNYKGTDKIIELVIKNASLTD